MSVGKTERAACSTPLSQLVNKVQGSPFPAVFHSAGLLGTNSPLSPSGQGSVVVPDSGGACTLVRLALVLSPETPSGKPLAAVLRPSLLPAMAPPNATPCKAALLSVASAWVPGNAGGEALLPREFVSALVYSAYLTFFFP